VGEFRPLTLHDREDERLSRVGRSALQHVHDAADDAAIVHPLDAPDIRRQVRFDPLPLLRAIVCFTCGQQDGNTILIRFWKGIGQSGKINGHLEKLLSLPIADSPGVGHDGWQKITFSTRRGERVYSRKCAFLALLISSASYTECALYLPRANDGQTARPSH
jgi:hypothetical protein